MQIACPSEMSTRSEILVDALDETIAELRLIDAGDMIAYIRAGQWANISDLVQSSSELSFRDGTVSFAYSGDYALNWGETPSIFLDMEFQTHEVTAFFTLTIGAQESAVRIRDVLFTNRVHTERAATAVFARAVATARRDAVVQMRSGG